MITLVRVPVRNQIVVDELQDFNRLEMTLISHLSVASRVLAAGDDDQALYRFKHATPAYIRDLFASGDYKSYELPYCFRCNDVIVQTVHDIVEIADANGSLSGRIDKKFWTHPAKDADSAAFPKVQAVRCTVDSAKAPYPARYVLEQIRTIDQTDVEVSNAEGYPTAMVIGPSYFISRVEELLLPEFPNNIRSRNADPSPSLLLDGYERLAKDEHSRWGWRLVTSANTPENLETIALKAMANDVDLDTWLDDAYKQGHLSHVQTVRSLQQGNDPGEASIKALSLVVEKSEQEIRIELGLDPKPPLPLPNPTLPTIALTTFMGAKGLSACHVFVVGMINGHFPRKSADITDTEICEFIVALTRTRKQCHLITSGWYAGHKVTQSQFYSWVQSARLEWRSFGQKNVAKAKK
jgi:superfamily I DNA/RNA helicase